MQFAKETASLMCQLRVDAGASQYCTFKHTVDTHIGKLRML
jgi:hypothetical protein